MPKSIEVISPLLIDNSVSSLDLVKLLLTNRHVKDLNEFLKPKFPNVKLKLTKALTLINQAIAKNKNILIYGDYDVDGLTATTILWQAIYSKTKKVIPFIPHRQKDGYGIKADSFFRFQSEKGVVFDLLITVDNGIVANKEFSKIKAKQPIKIIVTDHHFVDKIPPSVDAIIHTTALSGAGISWFIARKLYPNADLGLAALGTVADCLPLNGLNRSIVVHGLKELRLNPSPGIKKLMQISNINPDKLSAYDLGFAIGPRLNAVGRLSDPTDALRLLCSQNLLQAAKFAQSLNSFNHDRQKLQQQSLDLALTKINLQNKILFVADKSYNPGVIGLIAGKLTDKYYLPSICISIDGDLAKGSCRSIPELNIIESLKKFEKIFIDLGGHSAAAGFSLKTANIPKLQKSIIKYVNAKLTKINLQPHLEVDAQMALGAVTLTNIKSIAQLAPFGIGNPEPLFLFKQLTITNKRTLGTNNDHLKLKFGNLDAIAFKKGDLDKTLKIGDSVDIVAHLSLNEWNNLSLPQLIVKDIYT